MPTLLKRPQIDAAEPDELNDSLPVADLQFRTITDDQLQRLNDLFYRTHCAASRSASRVAFSGAAVVVGGLALNAGGAFATGGGGGTGGGAADAAAGAAASIASGVTNAINMIKAIDGIGLAAFGVALAPMGFMVTLRVLNMVLSRV